MEFYNIPLNILILACLAGVLVERGARAQSMCEKFNIGGPCDMLGLTTPTPTTPPPDTGDSAYCMLACSQGDPDNFKDVCYCARTLTTTTVPPTTTPERVTCYYGTQRAARLSSMRKRMYSPTPVATECDYPGVVGLFKDNGGTMEPACVATILREDRVLITEQCLNIIKSFTLYVMADSYQMSSATTAITVVQGTQAKLDKTKTYRILFTISLSEPLVFNSTECVQPACVPNVNIPASDIDLNDCRIVGYGSMTDSSNSVYPSQLMEVKVTVDPSTITNEKLKVTRVDGQPNAPCFGDDGAPLICSHATTGEWITIGITTAVGIYCTDASLLKASVHNLLGERTVTNFYDGLQTFPYADPTVFAA